MTFVDSWDSGLQGATWDSGLQWDVNVGAPGGNVAPYLALVTSEHRDKPKFMAMIAMLMQTPADMIVGLQSLQTIFDLDTALGAQLDAVGEWIGVDRHLRVPLPNSWFSWDVVGLGWDEGSWHDPNDPTNEVITLPDDAYRTLLRARVVNNQWDGTIPAAYSIWETMFEGTGSSIDITDNGDMTMEFTLRGTAPDAITTALLDGGYLSTTPAGVEASYGYVP